MPVLILNHWALSPFIPNQSAQVRPLDPGGPGALSLFWSFWKIPEYGPRQLGPLPRSRGGLPRLAGPGLVHFLSCLPITKERFDDSVEYHDHDADCEP